MRDTEREAETQAEGEAGSPRGAPCGTRSQDPRDHTLSRRQRLNHWATQASLIQLEFLLTRTHLSNHLLSLLLPVELPCLTSLIRSPWVHFQRAAHSHCSSEPSTLGNLTNPPLVLPPSQTFWNSNSGISKPIYTIGLFFWISFHSSSETL